MMIICLFICLFGFVILRGQNREMLNYGKYAMMEYRVGVVIVDRLEVNRDIEMKVSIYGKGEENYYEEYHKVKTDFRLMMYG